MPDAPTTGRRTAVRELLDTEAASGTVLVVLGAVALIWADGPAVDEYESLFATRLGPLDFRSWVNAAR